MFAYPSPPILFKLQCVIAEHHSRLWILQRNGLGFFVDLEHLVQLNPAYAAGGWSGWRTVQIVEDGQHLRWEHGATLGFEDLRRQLGTAACFGHTHLRSPISEADFYRPLKHGVPSPAAFVAEEVIMDLYAISDITLRALAREYAAPPELLYLRLHDLCLALASAYTMSVADIRKHFLHRGWHSATFDMANRGHSPFEAIQMGELTYVEATLFPHSTFQTRG